MTQLHNPDFKITAIHQMRLLVADHGVQKLYQLPKGWEWKKISELAEFNPTIAKEHLTDSTLVTFVPMPAVGADNGMSSS